MGLDMYLSSRRSGYGEKLSNDFKDYSTDELGCSNRVTISKQVGYWRKANAIHGWFVKNVQDGNDDCREYDVSTENLRELRDICKEILDKMDGTKFYIEDKEWNSICECAKNGNEAYKNIKKEFVFHKNRIKEYFKNDILYSYNFLLTEKVRELIAEKLEPTKGFFFGGYDIDGGYVYDLIKTVLIIDRVLDMVKKGNKDKIYYDFTYCASW